MEIVRTGDSRRRDLDLAEQHIAGLQQKIKGVLDARVPHDETRARLKAALEAKIYRTNPENMLTFFQTGVNQAYAELPDVFDAGTMAYILGVDHVLDLMIARIEATNLPVGFPAAERAKCVADLRAQLRSAEVAAEVAALQIEAMGLTVLRRPDANVEVLLEACATLAA